MAEINNGLTLYDMSKQILEQADPLDSIKANEMISDACWKMANHKYLMLYCKNLSDFTIFKMTKPNPRQLIKDLQETLFNRGAIIMIEEQDDGAWEFWIRDMASKELNVYYLFDYSQAVIEVI